MTTHAQPQEPATEPKTVDLAVWLASDRKPDDQPPPPTTESPPGSDLTDQRKEFVKLFLKSGSKSAAYNLAFPGNRKQHTAIKEAGKLLRDPRVARYEAFLRAQGPDYADVSKAQISHGLGLIAFADLGQAFDAKGNLLPPNKWPESIRFAAAGYTEKETATGYQRTLKMPDRNVAYRTLAEMHGHLKGTQGGAPAASFTFNFGPRPPAKPVEKGRTIEHDAGGDTPAVDP